MYLISNHQLINSTEIISLVGPDKLTISSISLGFKSLYSCHFVMHGRCLLSVCIVSELRV